MTAVYLNAAGGIGQIIQSAQGVNSTERSDQKKTDFGKLMMDRSGNRTESTKLKTEDAIKQPTRTELKSADSSKARNITQKKQDTPQVNKKGKADETAEELLAGAAEVLNVTPEELKAAMDSLNLKIGDLTDRNNVAQLILLLNGSEDISDMLIDNGMLEAFNELNDYIAETLEEAGLTAEEFKELLNNAGQDVSKTAEGLSGAADEDLNDQAKGNEIGDDGLYAGSLQKLEEGPEISIVNQETESETGSGTTEKGEHDSTLRETANVNLAENFVRNLEMAADQIQETDGNVYDVREIVYQVVDKIRVSISPDNTSMEMQLNPENLGRVSINITSKSGVMTAQINTENRQAREAIESQLQILKENIEAKGIKVEAVEVRVSDFNLADSRNSESSSRDQNGEASGNSRRTGNRGTVDSGEITEEERIAREVLADTGSTVSYRA